MARTFKLVQHIQYNNFDLIWKTKPFPFPFCFIMSKAIAKYVTKWSRALLRLEDRHLNDTMFVCDWKFTVNLSMLCKRENTNICYFLEQSLIEMKRWPYFNHIFHAFEEKKSMHLLITLLFSTSSVSFLFLIKSHIMYSDLDTTMYDCVFLSF